MPVRVLDDAVFGLFVFISCIPAVVSLQTDVEMVKILSQLEDEIAGFANGPDTANLLVIAADHGEGTTGLSHALGEHPCIISIGEPFDTVERWFSPSGDKALIRGDGKRGNISNYAKLEDKVDQAMLLKGQKPFNLSHKLHIKHPNLLDFFETVQTEVCEHAQLPAVCGSRCLLLHKIFPAYFTYNFSHVDDYLKSNKTMVIQVIREEAVVIQANRERFNMGQLAMEGLRSWNSYLNAMQAELMSSKVWTTVKMDGHIFRSPHTYFETMKGLLTKFGVPTDDDALARVKYRIEVEFREYALRRARLLETTQLALADQDELETA